MYICKDKYVCCIIDDRVSVEVKQKEERKYTARVYPSLKKMPGFQVDLVTY